MPKEDGSLLQIELLRSESWLRDHLAALVSDADAVSADDIKMAAGITNTLVASHADQSSSAGPWTTTDLFAEPRGAVDAWTLSPDRPIFQHLQATAGLLERSGYVVDGFLVELELPELAISGPAILKELANAPPIPPGPGQVITATFCHSSSQVIDLVLEHSTESTSETIGTTASHPFWSADRGSYIEAGSLEVDERVQTFAGDTKRVVSKLARPGPEPVYNLEVHAQHVYFVGRDGILVHNSCAPGQAPPNAGTSVSIAQDVAILKSVRRHVERLATGKAMANDPATQRQVTALQNRINNKQYAAAGTRFHLLNFKFINVLKSKNLLSWLRVDKRIATPGGARPIRRPDYNFSGQGVYDLKPFRNSANAYNSTDQYVDIGSATGVLPISLYYRLW